MHLKPFGMVQLFFSCFNFRNFHSLINCNIELVLFFLMTKARSILLSGLGDPFVLQNPWVSSSWGQILIFSMYNLSVWSTINHLHNSVFHNLFLLLYICPVGWWGCKIHRLLLCRGVRPPPNECLGYDIKQSDGEVPVILELWGMQSTPSLTLLPGPGVIAPDIYFWVK